jgi:gliding motility-associated-like protein
VPNIVYDVAPGLGAGEILVCGRGFFGSVNFPNGPCATSTNIASTPSNGCPCNGTANVSIQQACASGTYTYQWLPYGGTNDTAVNLCPGTYSVIATNTQSGNIDTLTVVVGGNSPSVLANATATDPTCFGYSDGAISTNPSGGTSYTYLWAPGGEITQNVTGLSAGSYTVTVTDASGCSGSQVIVLTQPQGMSFTLASASPFCTSCNGSASVVASGGSPGYSYNWLSSPTQANDSAFNLCAGAITVEVTDNNGCMQDTSLTLTAINPLLVTTTAGPAIACNGDCTGSATAAPSNGIGPYSYSWNTTPVQTTATASNLCAGTYIVTVTDSNSCVLNDTIAITEPTALTSQTLSPLSICNGDCATLSVAVSGGTQPYTLNWNPGSINGNNVSVCPTATQTYTVLITDNNSCTLTDSVLVNVLALPAVAFTADTFNGCSPLCVQFTNNTPNTGSLTWIYGDGNFDSDGGNCYGPGTFDVSLIVVGTNGCTDTLTQQAYIDVYPIPIAAFSLPPLLPLSEWEPEACFTNTSSGGITWSWDFNDPNDPTGSTVANPCHLYSDTGVYCIELTAVNANGCADTTTECFEIVPEGTSIYVPNSFTPNGDGKNEVFIPVGDGITNDRYHRWGMLIFESTSFSKGWDGTLKGNSCQVDVYVWTLSCYDDSGYAHNLRGHVSLVR